MDTTEAPVCFFSVASFLLQKEKWTMIQHDLTSTDHPVGGMEEPLRKKSKAILFSIFWRMIRYERTRFIYYVFVDSRRAMIGSMYGPYFTERPASTHLIEMLPFLRN